MLRMTQGRVNPDMTLEKSGITGVANAYYNLQNEALVQQSLLRGEGELGKGGALLVSTGKHTGRSPRTSLSSRKRV